MLKSILGFIGGRQAQIFDKKGRVKHDLGNKKWEAWKKRLAENPNYNWKNHKGKKGLQETQSN